MEYDAAGNVVRCPAIVVSTQHSPDISIEKLREAIVETVIKSTIPAQYIDAQAPSSLSTPPAALWWVAPPATAA